MGDDTGTSIQNQNLIGDDVADEINSAIGEQMSGNVTPPTVVQPTHTSGSLMNEQKPADDSNGTVATPDEPAVDPPADEQQVSSEPSEEPVTEEPSPAPSLPPEEPGDDKPATAEVTDDERGSGNFSELQSIKQQALTKLAPLVEHLDQDPEERFNTLLMMIRASDDASLVQPAYDAANKIEDDKKRAQALLDVVNEVNYLTRPTLSESA